VRKLIHDFGANYVIADFAVCYSFEKINTSNNIQKVVYDRTQVDICAMASQQPF
jgi:hypothetical protein